jgi:hypothetical protein
MGKGQYRNNKFERMLSGFLKQSKQNQKSVQTYFGEREARAKKPMLTNIRKNPRRFATVPSVGIRWNTLKTKTH